MEALHMSTANVEVPNVTRTEYTLIDVSDDFLSLMDADGNTRQDIRTPDHLKNELKTKFEAGSTMFIIVMMAMGQEVAQEYREVTAGKTA
jgi:translation initiation factor 5A